MFRHKGGDTVKGGFYWNQAQWHLENVEGKAGVLPGGDENRYARVPTLLLFVLAPLMGALFVVFLPFIGFALLIGMLIARGLGMFKKTPVQMPKPPAEGEAQKTKAA
ncbi:MAG TPA: hypothetical protein VK886_07300 [Vicinamibacterales bacterium]|nr:hypothetical protein [Vicinamibacterales bacterium]